MYIVLYMEATNPTQISFIAVCIPWYRIVLLYIGSTYIHYTATDTEVGTRQLGTFLTQVRCNQQEN